MNATIGGRYVEREAQERIPQVWIVVDQGDEERCDGATLDRFNIDAKEAAEDESEDIDVTARDVVRQHVGQDWNGVTATQIGKGADDEIPNRNEFPKGPSGEDLRDPLKANKFMLDLINSVHLPSKGCKRQNIFE